MHDNIQLKDAILSKSVSKIWSYAVVEWEISSMEEDEDAGSICLCGNTGLRYLYEIRNRKNGNFLFPIGSTCIKKFERDDLDEEVENRDRMLKLMSAVKRRERIVLSSTYFSRKLLDHLRLNDVFNPTSYNNFNGYNDYLFMLDMFNKRTKTPNQERKATAIIMNSIMPYIRSLIRER